MNSNDFVKFILNSPLNFFMGNTMLITVTGRKTGNQYTTPVGYYQEGQTLWVISSRDRTWWRNVCGGAEVNLHLHGHDEKAFAESVLDEKAVTSRMEDYLYHVPLSAKPLGVHTEHGIPDYSDVVRAAKERLFIKIKLERN